MFKQGKIFGINLLDLLIILGIIGAAIFLLTRQDNLIAPTEPQTFRISFFQPIIDPFVVEPINIGDNVEQHGTSLNFGTVVAIETGIGYEWNPNAEGVLTASRAGEDLSLWLTSEVTLPAGSHNNGIMIHGNRFAVGQTVTIRAGDSVLHLRISGIEEA
ncbi:MAG: DUF4330 family protein [Defluviitaleaceae bacterium]|nr:DUF4330 family protein [Defluviitaleaceae bacterium]